MLYKHTFKFPVKKEPKEAYNIIYSYHENDFHEEAN